MGTHVTVFQAEGFAISYCELELLSASRQEDTGEIMRVTIMLISAKEVHYKDWLFEEADRLEKLGAQKVEVGPEPSVEIVNSKVILSLKSLA